MYLAYYLPWWLDLVVHLIIVLLAVVAVVRSRGAARILVCVWLVTTVALLVPLAAVAFGLGVFDFYWIAPVASSIGMIVVAVALIVGRPGYRGEKQHRAGPVYYAAPPQAGYHPYGAPPQPGPYPYGMGPQAGPYPYGMAPQPGPYPGGQPNNAAMSGAAVVPPESPTSTKADTA